MADVIVIGAGISGLAAAHRLRAKGADVQVFERGSYAGGNIRTIQRDGWRHEFGPNSFLGSADAVRTLAEESGVTPLAAKPAASKRYLFMDGALQSLPANPADAIRSKLLPMSAKLRLLAEGLTEARPAETDSVRDFFEQRIGREATDRFVDAFVSGIYGGDISVLGIAAAFPKVYEMAITHGSLSRAVLAMVRGPRGTTLRGTYSFAGGLGELPKAIATSLGDRLHLDADMHLSREGGEWRVGGVSAPSLILATPAGASSKMLAEIAPDLSGQLSRITYNAMVGVHLLFARDAVPHAMDGFGFLVPRREGLPLLGCIWNSALFDVCTNYAAAVTCFVGGAHDPTAVDQSDDVLLRRVLTDLHRTMGIRNQPVDHAIIRHTRAIPQYGRNHVALRAEIQRLAGELPGLSLAGNYLHGISMNESSLQGEHGATEALEFLAGRGSERAA